MTEKKEHPVDSRPDAKLTEGGLPSDIRKSVAGGHNLTGRTATESSDVDLGGGTGSATTYGAHF